MEQRDFLKTTAGLGAAIAMSKLFKGVPESIASADQFNEAANPPGRFAMDLLMQISPPHTLGTERWDKTTDPWTPVPAFSPDEVRRWIRMAKDVGTTLACWSTDYVGKATYPSKVVAPMTPVTDDHYELFEDAQRWGGDRKDFFEYRKNPLNGVGAALNQFDTLEVGMAEAHKVGLPFCADMDIFDTYFPELESDFFEAHPELYLMDRQQKPARYIPCYAEPVAQDYRLRQIKELIGRGINAFHITFSAHAASRGIGKPDSLGFNPAVVKAYKQRHGVNILTEDFEPAKLHELNGDLFTDFLRKIRKLIGPGRRLIVQTSDVGYFGFGGAGAGQLAQRRVGFGGVGPLTVGPDYRINLQSKRWIKEGIVDALTCGTAMEGNSVERLHNLYKTKLLDTPVYLTRKFYRGPAGSKHADYPAKVERELEAMRDGQLDGLWFRQISDLFVPPTSPYIDIFKRQFGACKV